MADWFPGIPIRQMDMLLRLPSPKFKFHWYMPSWVLSLLSLLCWMGVGLCVSLMMLMSR